MEKGVGFLRVWFLCAPGMCFTNLFCSIFQAMGKWVHSLVLSVIRQIGLLLPAMLLLTTLFGETGLICAQPAADILSLFVGVAVYRALMRKTGEKA